MPSKQSVKPAGIGRKRPLLNVPIDRLHLDPENPRLPEEAQGREEDEVLKHLFEHFDLEEIAAPMAQNGYFDEEPLVVIPQDLPKRLIPKEGEKETPEYLKFLESAVFTVVEGNRRLATARILRNDEVRQKLYIRGWPVISDAVREDLDELPVIIYPTRQEVLPYLGVRHITGNKKWGSYAKARYIAAMLDEEYEIPARWNFSILCAWQRHQRDSREKNLGKAFAAVGCGAQRPVRTSRNESDFQDGQNQFAELAESSSSAGLSFFLAAWGQ